MDYISKDDIINELFTIKRNRNSKLEDYKFLSTIDSELLTQEILKKALDQQPLALQYIVNQSEEICIYAVQLNGMVLNHVKDKTPLICLEAVKNKGQALIYVENQTEFICLEAIKKDPFSLQCVDNQTTEICMEAVRQNGLALIHVKHKTPEICLEALLHGNKKNYELIMDYIPIVDKNFLTYKECKNHLRMMIQKRSIIMKEL